MVILLNMFRYLEYEGYIGEHVQVSRIQRVILVNKFRYREYRELYW